MNVRMRQRETNIELLRIISMTMIIILHFMGYGEVLKWAQDFSILYYVSWTIEAVSFVAVNCYVLITGYFQIDSKFKYKKVLGIWGKTFFYSVVLCVVSITFFDTNISFKKLVETFFPLSSGVYWFISVYVILYLLSPFINRMLRSMKQKEHIGLISVLILLFSFVPNIAIYSNAIWLENGMGVCWFVTLYCIGAYIRKYYVPTYKKSRWAIRYLGITILIPITKIVVHFITRVVIGHEVMSGIFYANNSVLVLGSSVLLFVFMLNIKIKNQIIERIILWLSPSTLAVYLIHENPYVRELLWAGLNIPKHMSHICFGIYSIVVVLIIYIVCTLIDKIRVFLFNKLVNNRIIFKMNDFIEQAIEHSIARFVK